MTAVVRVENVSKRFRIYHQRHQTLKQTILSRRRGSYEEFWAVRDVDLEISRGSTFGIVGVNGSGKSTLLKMIAGILKPDRGRVAVEGRLAALLELGAGFHPEYTGRENIYLNGALLGLSRTRVDSVLDDIVGFSELARFIDNPVKTYSSGMYARLGFAIAVHLDPEVLVVDEILAVGDMAFQRRCYERIDQMKAEGRTLILVSHALDTVREHCTECAWLDQGRLMSMGPVDEVVAQYVADARAREEAQMREAVADVHRLIPSGRGGVGVTSVSFGGTTGEGHEFDPGEDFEVRLAYHSPGPELRGARFVVEFVRDDGLVVFSCDSGDQDFDILPGSGTVRLQVPGLPLLGGLYRASVTILDGESGEPYTVLANAFPFRVNPGPSAGRGLVQLPHRWVMPGAAMVGSGG